MTPPYDVYGIIIRWLWMIFFSPRLFELKIHHSLVIAKLSAKLEILSIFLSLFQCYISVPCRAYSIFFSLSFANVTDRLHEGTAFCVSSWLYTMHFRGEPLLQKFFLRMKMISFSYSWYPYELSCLKESLPQERRHQANLFHKDP